MKEKHFHTSLFENIADKSAVFMGSKCEKCEINVSHKSTFTRSYLSSIASELAICMGVKMRGLYRKNISKYASICFITVSIVLLGFLLGNRNSYADNQDISVEITYGNQGMIKYNCPVPIKIKVTNHGEDFQGTIRVYVPNIKVYSDTAISSVNFIPSIETENQNYMYEKEIRLPKEEQVELTFETIFYQSAKEIRVTVLKDEEELYSKQVKIQSNDYNPKMLLGILSNEEIDLSEYNNISVGDNYLVSTKALRLEIEDINKASYELQSLDAVLVNGFSLESLDTDELAALIQWVEDGGCLIIGKSNYNSTIEKLFMDTDLSTGTVECLTNNQEISVYLKENGQEPTLTKASYGNGEIGVLGYDMKLEDSVRWQYITKQALAENLENVMGDKRIENVSMTSVWYISDEYYSIDYYMSNLYFDKTTNTAPYIIILIIYIIVVGPGLYLLLKKMRKRQFIWGGVGVLGVVFTLIIFVMSSSTRITAPFIHYLSIKTIAADHVEDLTYLNLQAPYNEDYSLYVDNSYSILPIIADTGYSSDLDSPLLDGYAVGIIKGELENTIEMKGLASFSSEYFKLEREEADNSSKATIDIHYYDGEVWGKVTNQSGYDLENATVVLLDYIVPLGDLQDGETKDLSECNIIAYGDDIYYNDRYIITDSNNDMNQNTEQSTDIKQKNAILKFFINTNLSEYTLDAYVVGFSTQKNQLDLQLDSGYDAIGQTIISIPTDISFSKDNLIYDPYINYKGKNRQGDFGDNNNYMSGEEVIIDYSLGESLEDISLEWSMAEVSREDSIVMFTGEVYFFNQKTSEYDQQESYYKTFTSEELKDYLTGKNELTIKYTQSMNYESEAVLIGSTRLPILKLTGRIQ